MEGYIQCQHYEEVHENEGSATTIKNSGHVTIALILGFILQSLINFMVTNHAQGVHLLKVFYSTILVFFIFVPIVIIVKIENVLHYLQTRLQKIC